jgi:hypothetical protein
LSQAAKRAKVDRRTHYNWLKDDPWYVQEFRQAVIVAGDSLQDKLTEMAFEGNVTAAIFLLKGLKAATFRDRVEQTNRLDIDPDKLTPAQKDVIAQHLIERAFADHPEVVPEVRRRLEAGELVRAEDVLPKTVEATFESEFDEIDEEGTEK